MSLLARLVDKARRSLAIFSGGAERFALAPVQGSAGILEGFVQTRESRTVTLEKHVPEPPDNGATQETLAASIDPPISQEAGTVMEVRARDRTGTDLRGAENFLRAIIEAAPNVIYAKDLDGRVQLANKAALELIGKPWPEVRGRTDAEFLADRAQGEAVMANDRRVIASGQPQEIEEWVGTGGAPPRLFLSTKSPVRDEDGAVIGLVGVSLDITDRKTTETAAIENAHRINALNEALERAAAKSHADRESLDLALNASGMIGIWDGDLLGGLVYGDENFARLYGLDPAETARGKPLGHYFQFIHPDDVQGAEAEMARMKAGAEQYNHEHRIIRPDGTQLWILARGRLTRDADGRPVRFPGVSVDITERREAESRQAFLLQLQDIMRGQTEPRAILDGAARHLGRYLRASRIGYGDIQEDDETVIITCGYADGVPEIYGTFKLADFGAHNAVEAREGLTTIYDDVLADPQRNGDVWDDIGTRALVSVPLTRDGRYSGSLYVSRATPHKWAAAEIALIEEVAARIWDAAERGRTEAKLRESEERARLALESGGFGTWEYDAATFVTTRSLRHDQIFGYDSGVDDWSFERFLDHVLPEDRVAVEAAFAATAAAGVDLHVECRILQASHTQRWIEVRARRQTGGTGRATRYVGIVADITERKIAEAAAIETGAQFRVFAQAMANHVWTATPDGQLDWFNERIFDYGGLTYDQLVGSGWACMVHPEDLPTVTALWGAAIATGEQYETEFRLRRFDGAFRWHLVRAVAIRDGNGRMVRWIGTNTDIDDQKATARALATLNASLEDEVRERTAELMATEESLRQSQKMEAVGQLTGGLAHDFNNLLTGISASLDLLKMRLEQGRVMELDRYVQIAQGGAKRAAALTHRLLAFSRRQTLAPKPTDMNRLVADMDDLIRQTVSPSVTVEIAGAIGLWPTLADPNQLENALLNLCINARDAMPAGGKITIATGNRWLDPLEARELDLPSGAFVSLCVSDTGTGMPQDIIERAFDPFFTTKPLGEGTGLGLSMVYGFVRQSGGQARIFSEVGQGTTVCLYLPRFLGDEAENDGSSELSKGHLAEDGEVVLIVDDEPSVRELLAEMLDDLGYRAIEAEDGQSGLSILNSTRRIDLLITDVGLPGGMNGRQLADAALITRPDLKILFITGYAENAVIREGHLKPGMHIATKPFALQTLTNRIRNILSDC